MFFHRFFVSGNSYLAIEYCSYVTGGHNLPFGSQNWRSIGGQILKSTVLDLWVSFHRIFGTGNPYMALEYCSDVIGGHNCHLKEKIGGQLEVKHLNLLNWTFGCLFIGFLSGIPYMASENCSDVN